MTPPNRRLVTDASSLELIAHTLTLHELLDGARDGLRGHVGELQRRYGPDLLRRVSREDSTVTGDTIVSDVFMKLPHALRTYQDQGKFEAWLWSIARNILTDRRRERQRLPEPVSDAGVNTPAQRREGVSFERRDLIERLAASLAPRQREVWLLNLEGYSDKETATRLGIEPNNVAQLLFRARAGVRKAADEIGLRPSDLIESGLGPDGF